MLRPRGSSQMTRVLIVGAGLTGCTVAWRLAQEGIDSVLWSAPTCPAG